MKTNKLIALALLVALEIILTRFLSFYVPLFGTTGFRAGFGHVPIILAGLLFGPIAGAMVGITGDVLGTFLFSPFPYFPGFTLSAALLGILSGLIMKLMKQRISFVKLLVLVYACEFIVSILMNTLFVSMIYGTPYIVLLFPRFISSSIMAVAYTIILYVLYEQLSKLDFIQEMTR